MEDLIKALNIFVKYKNEYNPTHCGHDWLGIMGITKEMVTPTDVENLEKLGFIWNDEYEHFGSFRFGSA